MTERLDDYRKLRDEIKELVSEFHTQRPLVRSGGNGHPPGMDSRVTRLETHFEYVRRDLDEIKTDQKGVLSKLDALGNTISKLPTSADLWTWRTQWIIICLTAVVIIVGSIIGGLAWIKPDSATVIIREGTAPGQTTITPSHLITK
jgi:hypothetical protein